MYFLPLAVNFQTMIPDQIVLISLLNMFLDISSCSGAVCRTARECMSTGYVLHHVLCSAYCFQVERESVCHISSLCACLHAAETLLKHC